MASALSLNFFLLFFVKAGYLKLSFTCHHHFKLGIILTPWKIRKISWNFKILIKLGYLNKFSFFFFFLWVKILSWPRMGVPTGTPLFIVLRFFVFLQHCGFFPPTNWRLMQPCIRQVCQHHFTNSICSLCVSLLPFGNAHSISDFFIIVIFVMVISDLKSLMLLLQLTEGSGNGQHFQQ